MKFDEILTSYVGDFGRFQRRLILLCVAIIPATFHMVGHVFFAANVDFWCTTPEFEHIECPSWWNLSASECGEAKHSFLAPAGSEGCLSYINATEDSFIDGEEPNDDWPIGKCYDWVYDTSQYTSTIIQEWNLVCDDKSKPAIVQSIYMTGDFIGAISVGFLADRFGRKHTFFISVIIQGLSGVAASYSPNFICYVCLRLLTGITNVGVYMLCSIICTEWVGSNHNRKYVTLFISIMWAMGYMTLAALAYFITAWRRFLLISSVSGLLVLLFFPFTPKSARWLINRGRVDETLKALEKAAKVNGKKLPDFIYDDKNNLIDADVDGSGTILDLFKTPNLRIYTIVMMFNWFSISCAYYGLSLGTSDLGANDYVAFWISGLVELPAAFLLLGIDKFGRRWSLCCSMLVGGVACILTMFTPNGAWKITTAMTGKFSVTFAFGLVFLYAAEIFPTPVRGIGMGISNISAAAGAVVAPLLLELDNVWESLSLLCFGGLTVAAGILALLLPETSGRNLPETLEDVKHFGKKRKTEDGYAEVETKYI